MLKNYDEVLDEIIETMRELDRDAARFQTDIYLYIENGIGRVTTFVNVGGNSWLNDDHLLIYEHKACTSVEEGWDEMSDNEKDEILGDYSDYQEIAMRLLDEVLERNGEDE